MSGTSSSKALSDGAFQSGTEGGSLAKSAMTPNITWTEAKVTKAHRWRLLGQRGAVVWLTGLSGSGKSTLALAVDSALFKIGKHSYLVDGDNLRHGLCRDLGFSDSDRTENIRRAGELASLMADAGLIVIVALISPFRADRESVRESCVVRDIPFIEVYVNAPLSICEQRDPKGLYRRARQGEIRGFTGIDSAYEPPPEPEVEVHTEQVGIDEGAAIVLARIASVNLPITSGAGGMLDLELTEAAD